MGLIVDTNVFIHFERSNTPIDLAQWDSSEDVFISVVTVAELLIGVYRADSEARRNRRSEFVEAIIASMTILDFTTAVARQHAQLYADLAQRGQLIGTHDLIISATALHHQLSLLTENVVDFTRIPNLNVIAFGP